MEKFENDKQNISINNKAMAHIDRVFSEGELLDRDIVNAWPQQTENVDRLQKISHYEQHYLEKGIRDVEAVRKHYGEKEANEHEDYYKKELKLRLEKSDPDQIIKYNTLVDEYNADLERIKKEKDIEKLKYFVEKALSIIDEKK